MRTRIKICGITNEADLRAAIEAGADAVGINMYAQSPRHVDAELAARLVRLVPPLVTSVGLFVNANPDHIGRMVDAIGFDLLQFSGDETDEECVAAGKPFIKSLRIDTDTDVAQEADLFPSSRALLLDAKVEGAFGGTGCTFDWTALPVLEKPFLLAGGLNADNVGEAIRIARPWAVDVSSGVELAKGRKDPARISAFVDAVRRADNATK